MSTQEHRKHNKQWMANNNLHDKKNATQIKKSKTVWAV